MRIDECARHFHSIDASQIDRLYVIKCQKIVLLNAPLNEFILFENIWLDISAHLASCLLSPAHPNGGERTSIDHRVRINDASVQKIFQIQDKQHFQYWFTRDARQSDNTTRLPSDRARICRSHNTQHTTQSTHLHANVFAFIISIHSHTNSMK